MLATAGFHHTATAVGMGNQLWIGLTHTALISAVSPFEERQLGTATARVHFSHYPLTPSVDGIIIQETIGLLHQCPFGLTAGVTDGVERQQVPHSWRVVTVTSSSFASSPNTDTCSFSLKTYRLIIKIFNLPNLHYVNITPSNRNICLHYWVRASVNIIKCLKKQVRLVWKKAELMLWIIKRCNK